MTQKRKPPSAADAAPEGKEFRKEDGQDRLADALTESKEEFRKMLIGECAGMATCLVGAWADMGKKILRIVESKLDGEGEEKAAMIRRAIEGDDHSLFLTASEMFGDEDIAEWMQVSALTFACTYSVCCLKKHADDPTGSVIESEMLDIINALPAELIETVRGYLQRIVIGSPYDSIREAASVQLLSRREDS